MKIFTSIGLIAVAVLLSMATFSYAKFTIDPSLTVREEYNDNIFLVQTGEEDDFITVVTPRIVFEYIPNRFIDLNLDYRLNFRFYSDHSDLNLDSIRDTQEAVFSAQARPFKRVYIDVNDSYRRVPEDIRNNVAIGDEVTNMTESNRFRISPYVEIPFTPSLLWRVGYRYVNIWYKLDAGNSSESNSGFTSLIKRFPIGLSVALNYDYIAFRPEATNDYDINQGSVSANYQVASNITVWGGVGKTYMNISGASDQDTGFWNLGSEYRIDALGDTTVTAMYSETISESETSIFSNLSELDVQEIESYYRNDRNSVTTGVAKIDEFSLEITSRKYVDITINPHFSKYDELESNREDKIKGININLAKPLTTKLTASFEVSWERQKFMPQDERVRQYSLSPSFDYILSRSITTGLGYRYNDRNSDIDTNDYKNNIVWLQARYDF